MAHTERFLWSLLDKISVEQKYQNYNLKITPISTDGANHSSHLFLVTITGKNRNDLNLFAKVAAIGEKWRAQTKLKLYATEQLFYTKLAKIYQQIEEKHAVPQKHRIVFPKLYGCNSTTLEETIVLENLTRLGFTTHNRFNCVEWEYAAAAVGELAKLHALSIAYQHERPEEFEQLLEDLKLEWPKDGSARETFLKAGLKVSMDVIKEESREKIKKFFDSINTQTFRNYYTPLRRAVIAHGDFKFSNLMHRVDNDGKVQVIVVDYQIMQGESPVVDLLFFIFSGTDEQFRAQHFQRLLDHYHAQLSLALQRLHLDPDEKYSREDFDYELKEKLPLGLIIAVYMLPVITAETEDVPKLGGDMELSSYRVQKTGVLFSERLNGVVNDFVKWGILK